MSRWGGDWRIEILSVFRQFELTIRLYQHSAYLIIVIWSLRHEYKSHRLKLESSALWRFFHRFCHLWSANWTSFTCRWSCWGGLELHCSRVGLAWPIQGSQMPVASSQIYHRFLGVYSLLACVSCTSSCWPFNYTSSSNSCEFCDF